MLRVGGVWVIHTDKSDNRSYRAPADKTGNDKTDNTMLCGCRHHANCLLSKPKTKIDSTFGSAICVLYDNLLVQKVEHRRLVQP